MATEVHSAIVTIPAGTPAAAPALIDVSFGALITERVGWRVPRGSVGLMGWRLVSSGAQIIPKTLGQWVIGDGASGNWALTDLHTSGDWHVQGYNTGAHDHAIHLEFWTSPVQTAATIRRAAAADALTVLASPDLRGLPPKAFAHPANWAR